MKIRPTNIEILKSQFELSKKVTAEALAAEDFREIRESLRICPTDFNIGLDNVPVGSYIIRRNKKRKDLVNIVLKVNYFDKNYEAEFGGMTHKEMIRYLRVKHHLITGPWVKKMRECIGDMVKKLSELPPKPRKELGNGFYIVYDESSNGLGYRMVSICLKREGDPVLCAQITDRNGDFINYPGYVGGDWEKDIMGVFPKYVKYPCRIFPFEDGKARFEWTVQPDGRYFEDSDGFGAEKCEEINLYSYIDEHGNFTGPFEYFENHTNS